MNSSVAAIKTASPSLTETFAALQARQSVPQPYPKMRDFSGMALVAATVIILAYSSLFNVLPILVMYAFWLPQLYFRGLKILHPSRDLALILCFPLWCCLSALWSDYRDITLYKGAEFTSMVVCTLIISRIVTTRAFLKGVAAGTSLALLLTIANGTYGSDYFSGTYSLVGLFGSKNQVGFIAQICALAAISIGSAPYSKVEKIIFSALPFLLAVISLYLSKSATAALSLCAVIALMACMYMVTRFPRSLRAGIFIITLATLCITAVIALNMDMEDEVLGSFGKDSTLTGRTYLWQEGTNIGLEKPFLGHGYSAFWVPGQPKAERYWYEFGILGKTGFHFHNLFVQSFVDLGAAGLLLISSLILGNCILCLRALIREGTHVEYLFPFAIAVMFLMRACVEVDFLGPFGIGVLLFFCVIPRIAEYRRQVLIQRL